MSLVRKKPRKHDVDLRRNHDEECEPKAARPKVETSFEPTDQDVVYLGPQFGLHLDEVNAPFLSLVSAKLRQRAGLYQPKQSQPQEPPEPACHRAARDGVARKLTHHLG